MILRLQTKLRLRPDPLEPYRRSFDTSLGDMLGAQDAELADVSGMVDDLSLRNRVEIIETL